MLKEHRQFLRNLMVQLLGIPAKQVVWSNQNLPRLKKPFATLHIYSQQAESMTEIVQGTQLATPMTALMEVQLFGEINSEIPADILERVALDISRPTIVEHCAAAGVAIIGFEPIIDLTGVMDDTQTYESRAALDIRFRYTAAVEDDDIVIHAINIEGYTDDKKMDIEIEKEEE